MRRRHSVLTRPLFCSDRGSCRANGSAAVHLSCQRSLFLTMRSMPTYRRGRTSYRSSGDSNSCGGFLLVAFIGCCLIGIPLAVLHSEVKRKETVSSLNEVLSKGIQPLESTSAVGSIISVQSEGPIQARVTDDVFSVDINGREAFYYI